MRQSLRFRLIALFLAVLPPACAVPREGTGAQEGTGGKPAASGPAAKADGKTQAGPAVPPLPPEKLPPRTAAPPDPARDQYRREKVYVHITESVQPKEGPAKATDVRKLEKHLAEYFRRAGFEIAGAADAAYRVEGAYEARFVEQIKFQGQVIAHKYAGKVKVGVRAKGGAADLETVEVPEFFTDGIQTPGIPEDQWAVLEMRRRLAKIVWERLYHSGKTFADPEIPALLSSLAADDSDNEAPVQARNILQTIQGKRLAAVPYLIEALTDVRTVHVNAPYPGVTSANSDKLKVYHLADKALEEIFQKVSRLSIDTPEQARFTIIRGWENEWERFCPSFRDSPQRVAQRRNAGSTGATSGPRDG